MNYSFAVSLCALALTGGALWGEETQTVTLDHKLQVPGTTLKPGQYTFAVEDRLQDRAIIKITNLKKNTHEFLLAVPNDKLNQVERPKLILFSEANSDKQILQGWMCSTCSSALEVVYPKGEAVKIIGESAKPVMAVDPVYNKLPKNLSPDDMKVVTLWLLSPKEITPQQKGKGVEAAKYADLKNKQQTEVAKLEEHPEMKTASADDADTKRAWNRAVAPPSPGAQMTTNSNPASANTDSSPTANSSPMPSPSASASSSPIPATTPMKSSGSESSKVLTANNAYVATADSKSTTAPDANMSTGMARTRRMPHTASNTYTFLMIGIGLLLAGTILRWQRRFSPHS